MIPSHPPKHIVMIAGEASGDQHAAELVHQIKKYDEHIQITGIGGSHMANAGMEILCDLAQYGVTGITEVLKHLRIIRQAFKLLKKHLLETQPDLIIFIDYPGFNLRMAEFAKKNTKAKILYYISPQVWAWKEGRIKKIQKFVDHMAVILPFEKKYYEQHQIAVSFVGHPLLKKIEKIQNLHPTREQLNLPTDKTIIALLPGSRINEVQKHMPVFFDAAKTLYHENPSLHFVIPIAETLNSSWVRTFWPDDTIPCSFIQAQALAVVYCSDMVVVASGTASLECALLKKPMCIVYRGALLTYIAATYFIRVKYIGLANLLLNQMAIPELLQYDFNQNELIKTLKMLLHDKVYVNDMQKKQEKLYQMISQQSADCDLFTIVKNML